MRTKQEKTFRLRVFPLWNILFSVVFCFVLSLFGGGCVTASVINDLGTTRTEYCDYRYRMSSDSSEIVFSSKRTKQYNYLPLYSFLHHKPAWTSIRNVEERIPLDPPPEVLTRRCTLTVTPDPAAPPAKFLMPVSIPDSLTSDDALRRLIVAPEPVDILTWKGESSSSYAGGIREFTAVPDRLPLSDGDTLRLRVRPRDMQYLAQPFRIRLSGTDGEADESPFGATNPAGSPLYVVQPDGTVLPFESLAGGWADTLIAGRIRGNRDGREYLMFPVDVDGGGLDDLAAPNSDSEIALQVRVSENLYPFRDKQTTEVMNEYRDSTDTPTVEAVCWKILWFPAALAADVIALPVYLIVIPIDYIIWENNNGFR